MINPIYLALSWLLFIQSLWSIKQEQFILYIISGAASATFLFLGLTGVK